MTRWQSLGLFRLTLQIAFIGALAFAFYFLLVALCNPVLDGFGFRQAQTAATAYWFNHGGSWLAYETPVLGYPWSVPFEFPTYQTLVALLSKGGLPITVSGRIISFAFYLGTLLPAYSLSRTYKVGTNPFLIFCILYLLSPLYMFWGRSVMIETAAVFFSAAWLAALAKFVEEGSGRALAVGLVAGVLAVLTKSTTLPAFLFLGGCIYLFGLYRLGPRAYLGQRLRVALGGLALAAVPLLVGVAWVQYSDAIKLLNPIGAKLTSSVLSSSSWTFGTLAQRLSAALWKGVIANRALPEIFGYGVLVAFVACAAALLDRRSSIVVLSGVSAFLVGILTFTNLHMIHNYYQVANAIFLIAAVAAGIQAMSRRSEWMAVVLLVMIGGGQAIYTKTNFVPRIVRDPQAEYLLLVGAAAAKVTAPQDTILVFGTDWSSEVPYYAERRGMAMPPWMDAPFVESVLKDPKYLGGRRASAIVDCYPVNAPGQEEVVARYLSNVQPAATFGACRLYGPAEVAKMSGAGVRTAPAP